MRPRASFVRRHKDH
ncbi:hypothetical protein HU200_058418 [Digitaria exilis]|uniref:Uncharacterized protein n=1 Tax=Digitaria exilis TaxID=1010633 RepID=A0A835E251_9POAL|nr:hypothetical protein HU200_058418 [Digitaria exilis]